MDKKTIIQKLTSRKFIVAAITLIAGIVTMIIGHEHEVTTIAGALMSIVPTVVYCIVEGTVDAKSVQTVTDAVSDAAEGLGYEQVAETVDDVGNVIVKGFVGDSETEE